VLRILMAETTSKGNELARGERLQIMLDADELRAIEDFRFTHRMPSRAAAVRELLKRGLNAEGFAIGMAGASSQSFGVIEPSRRGPNNGSR
jgi:hypothetical protein